MKHALDALEPRRLMAAGDLDTTFGQALRNVALPATNLSDAIAADVAIDSAGRSVVVGNVTQTVNGKKRSLMFLSRMRSDGETDMSFGTFGVQVIDLAAKQLARKLVIDASDRITIAYDTSADNAELMALSQFTGNGQLNRRFGRNGVAYPRFGPGSAVADVAVDPANNNLIFVANVAGQIGLGKLSPTGREITSFAPRSTVYVPRSQGATASAIRIDNAGALLIGATLPSSRTTSDFGVFKLSNDGVLRSTFGRKGVIAVDIAGGRDVLDELIIDAYGRIVLAGKRAYVSPTEGATVDAVAATARLLGDGTLDPKYFRRGIADLAAVHAAAYPDAELRLATRFADAAVSIADYGGLYRLATHEVDQDLTYSGRMTSLNSLRSDADGVVVQVVRGDRYARAFRAWETATFDHVTNNQYVTIVTTQATPTAALRGSSLYLPQAASETAPLADGRLLVNTMVGGINYYFTLRRDGTMDPSFGANGIATTPPELVGEIYGIRSIFQPTIMPLSDGTAYLAYTFRETDSDSGAWPINRISSTGVETRVLVESPEQWPYALHMLPRDTLYAYQAGSDHNDFYGHHLLSIRPNRSRSLAGDFSEDEAGENPTMAPAGNVVAFIPIEGSPRKLAVSYLRDGLREFSAAYITRQNEDGSPDSTFAGGAGFIQVTFPLDPLFAQSDGRVLYTRGDANGLFRLNANGTVDNTFGSALLNEFKNHTVDYAGRIVAWKVFDASAGAAAGDIQVARFTQNGKVDTTFGGGDGITVVDTKLSGNVRGNVMVEIDNDIVVTAHKSSASNASWSTVRIKGA